ncbi:MAG: protein translocase subunit SecD [Nitrospiria bacterium]
MKREVKGRSLFILATIVISILFLLPSTPIYSILPSWWGNIFPSRGITLGLDLRGGMHLILEVEAEKAVENAIDRNMASLKDALKDEEITFSSIERDGKEITLSFDSGDNEKITQVLDDKYASLVTNREAGGEKVLTFRKSEEKRILDTATLQALETIRNRIDEFGVTEPLIQQQGDRQILIQLPGVKEPERAIELIGKTAQLKFKLLNEKSPVLGQFPSRLNPEEAEKFLNEFKEKIDPEDEILFERIVNKETGDVTKSPYLVQKKAVMAGDLLTDARVSFGEFNDPYVSITFDPVGARLFEKVTDENRRRRLAIVLDKSVKSAPRIQEKISGGRAQITGTFTTQEAKDLAIILRAGSLPAPVKVIQNVTVGPSLGKDSIRKGLFALILGSFLVVVFMVVYYRLSGLLADFAMMLNLVLLVGALTALNATLTLPGIAGIILTAGLAVDANVLILERIREELRAGRPVRLAVDAGYNKAFSSIFDSNVTTLITGFALFMFGTGPIKGFAVTLSLGVMINLFTALVGTKLVYDFINGRKRLERLSI